jgi:uncharacterized delta-60 repeat protein
MKKLFVLPFLFACGDNIGESLPPDGNTPDSPIDSPTFVQPTPLAIPLSAAGNDQLLGATVSGTSLFAVGWRAATHDSTADRELVLVKLDDKGELDTNFGSAGIASLNAQVGGSGETWRGIVVQPSGKIVVSGVVEDETVATDRDVVVARFNANGTLDTDFGPANTGIHRLDLNTAIGTAGLDATWGLGVDSTGRIYVHAGQRTTTLDVNNQPLTDTDFVVIRLLVDGDIDDDYGTNGKHVLDILRSSADVRGIYVAPDGTSIPHGYAKSTSTGMTVQPVVYKLTADGELDTNFASGGVFHEVVLAIQTEVYGIAVQPDGKIVTAGYGRATGDTNDWISLRLTAEGALDAAWADQGKFLLDPSGTMLGDNCRNAVALPNGRTALIGSAGPSNATSDGIIAILDSTGKLDTAFGTGLMKFELGSNEAVWGGGVIGGRAVFVGFKGGGATPSASSNDDAYSISLKL